MPFHGTYVDFLTGDLIFGWDQHRAFFSKKYAKQPGEKRYMEDYGIRLSSSTAFGGKVQTDHKKYNAVVDKPTTETWTNDDSAQKCKGGLWWATRSSVNVHFYLGGLDMEMVCGRPGMKKIDGITCRELRWIYRFKDDTGVQNYIQFWRPAGVTTLAGLKSAAINSTAEKCGPPWDDTAFTDGSKIWGHYKPRGKHDINGVPT